MEIEFNDDALRRVLEEAQANGLAQLDAAFRQELTASPPASKADIRRAARAAQLTVFGDGADEESALDEIVENTAKDLGIDK